MGTGMRRAVLDRRARLWCAARGAPCEKCYVFHLAVTVLWGHYGEPTDIIWTVFLDLGRLCAQKIEEDLQYIVVVA